MIDYRREHMVWWSRLFEIGAIVLLERRRNIVALASCQCAWRHGFVVLDRAQVLRLQRFRVFYWNSWWVKLQHFFSEQCECGCWGSLSSWVPVVIIWLGAGSCWKCGRARSNDSAAGRVLWLSRLVKAHGTSQLRFWEALLRLTAVVKSLEDAAKVAAERHYKDFSSSWHDIDWIHQWPKVQTIQCHLNQFFFLSTCNCFQLKSHFQLK